MVINIIVTLLKCTMIYLAVWTLIWSIEAIDGFVKFIKLERKDRKLRDIRKTVTYRMHPFGCVTIIENVEINWNQ